MKKILFLVSLLIAFSCQNKKLENTGQEAPLIPRPTDFIQELWYKNSLTYSVDVEVFKDSDGDGVGDLKGLIQQLDYLNDLGVDAIWLAPFQPTPNRDDGYDVSDFYGIDKRLGTMADFDELIRQARQRNIRVMMDLVVNHTSDQHPWFQKARLSKVSPYRSWYVWSPERPAKWDKGMVFPGVQKAVWTFDKQAGEYYYHRFYDFQPDLNTQNPAVQVEIRKIVKHWIDKGIVGFRVDAVPFLIEVANSTFDPEKPEYQFDMIALLHQYVQWHRSDAILLGEANVDPKEQEPYFGKNGEGMQTLFNFFVNQHLFHSLATSEVKLLRKALEDTKQIPPTAQWANFLRNHDEIDLGRLSDTERQKVYDKFGPDTTMQLYDRGIRRRLAPMLGNRKLIDLAYSLLFALPGAPVIRYGEEIGMGDNLRLHERESVRTPMQWSGGTGAGFSTNTKTVRPIINFGEYGYTKVNVAAQRTDSSSLLSTIRRLSRLRKTCPEIGWSPFTVIDTKSSHVLVLRYDGPERSLLVVHNFSPEPQEVALDSRSIAGRRMVDLLNNATKEVSADGVQNLKLPGYGYNWYRVVNRDTTVARP